MREKLKLKMRFAACFLAWCSIAAVISTSAAAFAPDGYEAGTYTLEASLSCYVNAMGGIEFGAPLLTNTQLLVDEEGNSQITLYFTKSSVTIYSVTCDTFIDPAPEYVTEDRGVESGTIGYYDEAGVLQTENVSYTTSEDTALNPSDEEVHYVDSITFPLGYYSDTYNLTFYINSNVMGVQFTNASSAASATTYPATLTINWDGTAAAPASTADASQGNAASVVEEDGLTMYYADSSDASSADAGLAESQAESSEGVNMMALLNTKAFIVMVVLAIVILIVGIVLLVTAFKAEKANTGEASAKAKKSKKGKKEKANHSDAPNTDKTDTSKGAQ